MSGAKFASVAGVVLVGVGIVLVVAQMILNPVPYKMGYSMALSPREMLLETQYPGLTMIGVAGLLLIVGAFAGRRSN